MYDVLSFLCPIFAFLGVLLADMFRKDAASIPSEEAAAGNDSVKFSRWRGLATQCSQSVLFIASCKITRFVSDPLHHLLNWAQKAEKQFNDAKEKAKAVISRSTQMRLPCRDSPLWSARPSPHAFPKGLQTIASYITDSSLTYLLSTMHEHWN